MTDDQKMAMASLRQGQALMSPMERELVKIIEGQAKALKEVRGRLSGTIGQINPEMKWTIAQMEGCVSVIDALSNDQPARGSRGGG